MDELELDEWFNETRDELEAKFFSELQNNKDPEKARLRFDKQYSALIKQFQKKQESMYENKKRMKKIQAPWIKFKDNINELIDTISSWFTKLKDSIRKWFFERKIKRILRDKSDLYTKMK